MAKSKVANEELNPNPFRATALQSGSALVDTQQSKNSNGELVTSITDGGTRQPCYTRNILLNHALLNSHRTVAAFTSHLQWADPSDHEAIRNRPGKPSPAVCVTPLNAPASSNASWQIHLHSLACCSSRHCESQSRSAQTPGSPIYFTCAQWRGEGLTRHTTRGCIGQRRHPPELTCKRHCTSVLTICKQQQCVCQILHL